MKSCRAPKEAKCSTLPKQNKTKIIVISCFLNTYMRLQTITRKLQLTQQNVWLDFFTVQIIFFIHNYLPWITHCNPMSIRYCV